MSDDKTRRADVRPHGAGESLARRLERLYGTNPDPGIALSEGPGDQDDSRTGAILRRLANQDPEQARYRVMGEIARGGMGRILEVWDRDLRRKLAMKVMQGGDERQPRETPSGEESTALPRFLEEAQISGQLEHPGIVTVHELGIDRDGRIFFTMPLIRGKNLKRIFDLVARREEGWTRTRALGVLLKVCEAMAFAHEKGVIHRDLKPANVMVGRFGEVHVMDWGLARVLGRPDDRDPLARASASENVSLIRTERADERECDPATPHLTMEGDVMGTPSFMSPEQARGEIAQMDRRADVYALGAMLYHLLAGRAPYCEPGTRPDAATVWRRVKEGPPDPVHELVRDVPAELHSICEKAMARLPESRYADTMEMADDLRAYLENRVVSAHRTGPVVEFRKWVARNRALAASIGLALILILGGSLTAALVLASKNEEISVARDRAQRAASAAEALNAVLSARNKEISISREGAEQAAAEAKALSGFLVNELLIASTPEEAMGREITVREVLDRAAERVEDALADNEKVKAAVLHTLGHAYYQLGRPVESGKHTSRAYEARQRLLGDDHPDTLASQHHLGWTLFASGNIQEGEAMLRDNLERRRRVLGADSFDTLQAVDTVADLTCQLGRPAEAEPLYRENLEARRRLRGRGHATTLGTWHRLATCIKLQGRLEEAEAMMREVLEAKRLHLTENSPYTVDAVNDLASLLHDLGRFGEADDFYRQALTDARRVFGEDHPMYAVVLNNPATLLMDRASSEGRPELLDEAEEHLRASLELRRESYPEDHPAVSTALNNLAGLLHHRARDAEAEALLTRTLEIRREKLGTDHIETLGTLQCLAATQHALGRNDAAESSYRAVIETAIRTLPESHWRIGVFRDGYGDFLEKRGRFAEAEEEFVAALAILENTLGSSDHRTLAAAAALERVRAAADEEE